VLTIASSDDGRTWTLEATEPLEGTASGFNYSTLVDQRAAQPIAKYQVDESPGSTTADLQATFDGGKAWISYATAGLPGQVTQAQWWSPQDLWVVASPMSSNGTPGGRLYATSDGGKTWTGLLGASLASPTPAVTPIVAVTPAPIALTPEPSVADQNHVLFNAAGRIDAKAGWVVYTPPTAGPTLRITTDGGATWSEPRSLPEALMDVQFVDENHGWVVASGTPTDQSAGGSMGVFRTIDGGLTWKETRVDLGTLAGKPDATFLVTSLHFRDALNGEVFTDYQAGDSSLPVAPDSSPSASGGPRICKHYSTADGGQTWSGGEGEPCLVEAEFFDASLGVVGTQSPTIYVTADGGRTWISGHFPVPAAVGTGTPDAADVKMLERQADGTLRALVWWGGAGITTTVVSSDGGRTWIAAGEGQTYPGQQVARLGSGNWIGMEGPNFSAGTGGLDVLVTHDAGLTWTKLAVSGPQSDPAFVSFVNPTDGWAVLHEENCSTSALGSAACQVANSVLYGTRDGGLTWTRMLDPVAGNAGP
jgi:photosystem II stability/assembly factor-like uncharacterized protein